MISRAAQLIRYGGTAGVAACVDVGLFGIIYKSGLPLAPAAALSFLAATIVNYVLTAHYVFGTRVSASGYIRFLGAASLGFVLDDGTTMLVGNLFGLNALFAKIIGIGVAFFANFLLNVAFVFGGVAGSDQKPDTTKK